MLAPILALIIWTLIIWCWMYATRIPAMQKAKIEPQAAAHPGALDGLPAGVRVVADNYNHLHEQPTIFYALAFYSHLAGNEGAIAVSLAWGYVALRVAHSLAQIIVQKVVVRFFFFVLSTLLLVALAALNLIVALQ